MCMFCTEYWFLIWRASFQSRWNFARVIWDTREGLSVKVFSMTVLELSVLKCFLFKEKEKCLIDRWINGLMCCWFKISWHGLVKYKKPQKQRICLDAQMILFFMFTWQNHNKYVWKERESSNSSLAQKQYELWPNQLWPDRFSKKPQQIP